MRTQQQQLEYFCEHNDLEDAGVEFLYDNFNETFLTEDQAEVTLTYLGIDVENQDDVFTELENAILCEGEYDLSEMFEDFVLQDFFTERQCFEVLEYLREYNKINQ
jgi:hypothetical protein